MILFQLQQQYNIYPILKCVSKNYVSVYFHIFYYSIKLISVFIIIFIFIYLFIINTFMVKIQVFML